jgi:large subunit ribosomal protein L10
MQRKEVSMENPRAEKVAVVDEVRERLEGTDAVLLTEYRGLDVGAIAQLRRALREAGGEYRIYKNTLVRFAARDLGLDIEELLTGPTAIAFITERPDGTPGDAVNVAKALRDFARGNPALVVKGGVLGTKALSAAEARALADVAPRDELLARLAGGIAAPLVQLAGLLQALPRNMAYGLKALIDQKVAGGEALPEAEPAEPVAVEDEPVAEAPAVEVAETEAVTETETAEPETTETTETTEAEAADPADAAPAEGGDDIVAPVADTDTTADDADDTITEES